MVLTGVGLNGSLSFQVQRKDLCIDIVDSVKPQPWESQSNDILHFIYVRPEIRTENERKLYIHGTEQLSFLSWRTSRSDMRSWTQERICTIRVLIVLHAIRGYNYINVSHSFRTTLWRYYKTAKITIGTLSDKQLFTNHWLCWPIFNLGWITWLKRDIIRNKNNAEAIVWISPSLFHNNPMISRSSLWTVKQSLLEGSDLEVWCPSDSNICSNGPERTSSGNNQFLETEWLEWRHLQLRDPWTEIDQVTNTKIWDKVVLTNNKNRHICLTLHQLWPEIFYWINDAFIDVGVVSLAYVDVAG